MKALLFACALLPALLSAAAEARIFMKIDGVKCEATDPAHRDWCEVQSFTFWPKAPLSPALQAGRGMTSSGQMSNIIIVRKEVNRASPTLTKKATTGAVLPAVTFHFTAMLHGKNTTFLSYHLKGVRITGVVVKSTSSQIVPTEELELKFQQIKMSYEVYDPNGRRKGTISENWPESGTRNTQPQERSRGRRGDEYRIEEPPRTFIRPLSPKL